MSSRLTPAPVGTLENASDKPEASLSAWVGTWESGAEDSELFRHASYIFSLRNGRARAAMRLWLTTVWIASVSTKSLNRLAPRRIFGLP